MTNVKRKGLVYALILTLCLGVIPFNVASFQAAAETKSKAPAVTAKTYSKKAGEETKSAGAEKQEAENNTEATAPENEKTAADSAE